MTKRRMVTSAIWENPKFAAMKYRQQVLLLGLITNADDQGRLRGDPNRIKSLVFPYSSMSRKTIERDLVPIENNETIVRYKSDGSPYIQLVNWWVYQKSNWAAPSKYPAPQGWRDRIRFRRGNAVLTYNWPGKEDTCDVRGEALPSGDRAEPIANPEWAQGEPTLGPARDSDEPRDRVSKEKLSESERERLRESKDLSPPPPPHNPIQQFEQSFGTTISSHLRDDILDFQRECEALGHPEWVCEAILEAERQGVRKWSYAKACLNNWIKNGVRAPPQKGRDDRPMTYEERKRRYVGADYADLIEH